MARVAFPLVLQSPVSGSALVGAKATITKHVVGGALGSGAEAEIFTTETESTKVAGNVITTDNTGRWTQGEGGGYLQYWLPEGTYDVLISGTGLKAVYITRELVSGTPSAKSIIATEESRENVAFGTMPTSDEVTVIVPTGGMVYVAYQAMWQGTGVARAHAAFFVGTNQLKTNVYEKGSPEAQETTETGGGGVFTLLSTNVVGLVAGEVEGAGAYTGDVTTGQILGASTSSILAGGPCLIDNLPAGTYKISVQFKVASSKVLAKNRRLKAWVVG